MRADENGLDGCLDVVFAGCRFGVRLKALRLAEENRRLAGAPCRRTDAVPMAVSAVRT
jgi:hypothetical protein